jgi:coproporphyrinogen III oxidase
MTEQADLTPAEVKDLAQQWFDKQIAAISEKHGDKWPEHKEWIEDYLREEIRERLIARGWRSKK